MVLVGEAAALSVEEFVEHPGESIVLAAKLTEQLDAEADRQLGRANRQIPNIKVHAFPQALSADAAAWTLDINELQEWDRRDGHSSIADLSQQNEDAYVCNLLHPQGSCGPPSSWLHSASCSIFCQSQGPAAIGELRHQPAPHKPCGATQVAPRRPHVAASGSVQFASAKIAAALQLGVCGGPAGGADSRCREVRCGQAPERGAPRRDDAWRRLAERLRTGLLSFDQYEETLLELCESVSSEENHVHRIAVLLAIQPLSDLLMHGAPTSRGHAAHALGRLAREDVDYRASIVEAGAVPSLVRLLVVGSPGEQEQAANALASLAMHSRDNRATIAGAGAIPPLVDLLREHEDGGPSHGSTAARALQHLARNSSSNKAMIVLAGAIPALVDLLQTGTPDEQAQAATALGSLAAHSAGHEAAIRRMAHAAGCPLEAVDLNQAEEPVTLHIYDVSGDARVQFVNELFRPVGTGAFHAGVQVYGQEYSFGCRDDNGTGVFWCEPRRNPAHLYRECVPMDVTVLSEYDVKAIVMRCEKEWPGRDYDLFNRNCCHFADAFCKELGVGPVPGWVMNLAGTGASLLSGVQTAVEGAQVAAVAAAERAQAAATVVRQMDLKSQIWDTAEAAARSILARAFHAPPQSEKESRDVSPGPAAVDVVLECVQVAGDWVADLPRWQRCIGKKVPPGGLWPVGPRHQPQMFRRLAARAAPAELEDCLFELAWEPPCLYVIKQKLDVPLCINGVPVRQPTFVLLHNSEISLPRGPGSGNGGAAPTITFRVLRDEAAVQVMTENPLQPQVLVDCPARANARRQLQRQPCGDDDSDDEPPLANAPFTHSQCATVVDRMKHL